MRDDNVRRKCLNRTCSMYSFEVTTDRSHCLGCDIKLARTDVDLGSIFADVGPAWFR